MSCCDEKDLLVIIPAYNEEKNISTVLDALENMHVTDYADTLVINDSSSDNTNYIVRERKFALVTHVFNLGTEVRSSLATNMPCAGDTDM